MTVENTNSSVDVKVLFYHNIYYESVYAPHFKKRLPENRTFGLPEGCHKYCRTANIRLVEICVKICKTIALSPRLWCTGADNDALHLVMGNCTQKDMWIFIPIHASLAIHHKRERVRVLYYTWSIECTIILLDSFTLHCIKYCLLIMQLLFPLTINTVRFPI